MSGGDLPGASSPDARPDPPTPRRGRIGPFTGRPRATVVAGGGGAAGARALAPRPRAPGPGSATALPTVTPFIVGPVTEGLRPGEAAPELEATRNDGSTVVLADLDGNPVRLADLRGKLVWLNFWASWCPPCQSETPVLRDLAAEYGEAGLEIVGIAVQETTPDDVRAYAERYDLGYTIAFDASADIFHRYRVFALPTQFFIAPDGRILEVLNGPLTEATARTRIEAWLPRG